MFKKASLAVKSLFFPFCIIFSAVAFPCYGFGLKTHAWMAAQIQQEITESCKIFIAGRQYAIEAERCNAIRKEPGAFISGALGPDVYPDFIVGQVTTHPGVEGGWQTGDWIKYLIEEADSPSAIAFSSGYAIHAAMDMWAHTYVNTFAGDVFDLKDERAVEARHVAIEKYLDATIPTAGPVPSSLEAPAAHLSRKLIFGDKAIAQYRKSGMAPHIIAMKEVKDSVSKLATATRGIETNANELIANYIAANIEISAKIVTGELQLESLRETLRLHEQELRFRQNVYNEAKRGSDAAFKAVEDNRLLYLESDATYHTNRLAIDAADKTYQEASKSLSDLNNQLNDLRKQINSVPRNITREVCKEVVKRLPWPLNDIVKTVCKTVQEVNKVWENLNNAILETERNIVRETKRLNDAIAAKAIAEAKAVAALQRKAQAEGSKAGLEATQASAELVYKAAVTPLEMQESVTRETRNQVESIEKQVEDFRKQFADREVWVRTIRDALNDIRLIEGIVRNWEKGIDRAGEKYISTGLIASQMILRDEKGVLKEYLRWLSCDGSVFLATPYQIAELQCDAKAFYEELIAKIEEIKKVLLPPGVREIYELAERLQAIAKDEVEKAVKHASLELIRFVSKDESLVELLSLIEDPAYATREKLNELLQTADDSDGKSLLTFQNGAEIIEADAAFSNGRWNPDKFNVMKYALTMSRLSLLPGLELNRLAGKLNGNWFFRWKLHPEGEYRYTLISSTVRSIDGNHQWQPYGIPYARSNSTAVPIDGLKRHYGFGPLDGAGLGLRMFQDENARKGVFLKLFPASLSQVESDPRLQAPLFEFPSCIENPFPITFDSQGYPVKTDLGCR